MNIPKNIEKEAKDIIYKSIIKIIDRYLEEGLSIYDIKKYFKIEKSFNLLLNDINYVGRRYFDDYNDYKKFTKIILNDIIMDKISKIETEKIQENKIIKFNDFINEDLNINIDDLKDINIEYLFNDIGYSNDDKDILSSYFKTREDYIESKNDKYCVYTVTDFKTDITNNNRTTMDVLLLADFQLEKIKNNLINKIISEIYSKIPNEIQYLGILIKPHTLLDKEKLRDSIKKLINEQDLIDIISKITKYNYIEKYSNYYIWKNIK